jgi:hypothetical protein
MSTICKLDRNVRLDRYLRKQMLRDMRNDLGVAETLVKQGQRTVNHPDYKRYTNAARHKHEQLLREMIVQATVLKLTLRHISKICLDPRRTGAVKEAILAKLGGPKQ